MILRLFLSLTILIQSGTSFAAGSNGGNAAQEENQTTQTDTKISDGISAPVAYHLEGSREVLATDGSRHQISADVTVLQPQDEDGLIDQESQVRETFAAADKNHEPVALYLEGPDGKMIEAPSRDAFMSALQRMANGSRAALKRANDGMIRDVKAMPFSTVLMVSARGRVNYWGGHAMFLHLNYSHSQSVVAGVTCFMLSAILLLYGSFYAKWLKIDQSYTKLLLKGLSVQVGYLAIVETMMAVDGARFGGALEIAWGLITASALGTVVQTPVTIAAATTADEYIEKNPGRRAASLWP